MKPLHNCERRIRAAEEYGRICTSPRGAYGFERDPGLYRLENRRAADQVLQEIYEAIQTLVSFPQLGHSRPELTPRTLRFHPVRNYLIVYASIEKPLLIVAVLHCWRSPRVIAAFLRGRK